MQAQPGTRSEPRDKEPRIGALCYLTYSFADFLAPGFAAQLVPYIQVPSGLAEFSLCLWLLVIGVNGERWKEQTSAFESLPGGPRL